MELLVLHADRVARALQAAELAQQNQSQIDLLGVLGATHDGSQPQALYLQMRDTVRRVLDAPSFAVCSTTSVSQTESWFAYAERDGQLDSEARITRGSHAGVVERRVHRQNTLHLRP